jgi:hypothetical protein
MREETDITSVTYRTPRALLNNVYCVSVSTLIGVTQTFNDFNGSTTTTRHYGDFWIQTFNLTSSMTATNIRDLMPWDPTFNLDEATPVLIKPQPPRIGKPIDRTKNTGVFTSGDVTERQSDGQPLGFTMSKVSKVRFVRALQFSQGSVDTGRRTDAGIATAFARSDVTIKSDGSFAAEVPAEVPIQFQLLDKDGRVLVAHKPWVQVMRGETMRCVGCHANHSQAAKVQTLEARQSDPVGLDAQDTEQFHFGRDLQPIFNDHCVRCHDYALAGGAAAGLSLVGREVPGGETECFKELTGKNYVISQAPNRSKLIWRLTGKKLDVDPPTAYPASGEIVPHTQMLSAKELTKLQDWISAGINFRVVGDGHVSAVNPLDANVFKNTVWPLLDAHCGICHEGTGAGVQAFNLNGDTGEAETEDEVMMNRLEEVSKRVNYMVPQASYLLRKPLGEQLSGLTHVGGQIYTGFDDPMYKTLYAWIAAANPALAPAIPPTDLAHVENHPNPFRDSTIFVYQLQGAVAGNVVVRIYSQQGKMIRELPGPADISSTTMGWNRVEWDGQDKNGKVVGNDVYFYVVEAKFNDGTKKTIKGKCVKVK